MKTEAKILTDKIWKLQYAWIKAWIQTEEKSDKDYRHTGAQPDCLVSNALRLEKIPEMAGIIDQLKKSTLLLRDKARATHDILRSR